jgi:uncharacterized protein (DUF1684 family)
MTSDLNHADYVARWDIWHQGREDRRAAPHGFLSITAMHWLTPEPQRFEDAPGTWSADGDGVRVQLDDDETLFIEDVRVRGAYDFGDVDDVGVGASFGDVLIEVCRRDGTYMIRPRDPKNEVRMSYAGTPTYPVNSEWVTSGDFIPYDEPRTITLDTSVEGLASVDRSPGEVQFILAGRSHRLIAFNDEVPDELFIVFTDLSAGDTTYSACRFLTVDAPGPDGRVVVDFNHATNPPCAYTDFATCPLPPAGNHLPIRVEAGE